MVRSGCRGVLKCAACHKQGSHKRMCLAWVLYCTPVCVLCGLLSVLRTRSSARVTVRPVSQLALQTGHACTLLLQASWSSRGFECMCVLACSKACLCLRQASILLGWPWLVPTYLPLNLCCRCPHAQTRFFGGCSSGVSVMWRHTRLEGEEQQRKTATCVLSRACCTSGRLKVG